MAIQPTSSTRHRVAELARFVQEHDGEFVSMSAFARRSGISKFALSRAFTAIMQTSFRRYVIERRVSRAKGLLEDRQYSVTEVAQMTGFGDLPRFDKVFKKTVGIPPSEYRAEMQRRAKSGGGATNY